MALFGVSCGSVKMNGKMISSVLNSKGEKSKLYDDILDYVKDLDPKEKDILRNKYKPWEEKGVVGDLDNNKHLALAIYAQTSSENFKKLGLSKTDKGEYKFEDVKNNIISPKKEILQQKSDKKTESSKASPETIKRYNEWAKRAGFDMKILESLTDDKGNKIGANGVIDLLNKVIELVKGKEDVATGEEVGHGIIRMLKESNPALFKDIMNNVGKYDLYKDVVEQYGKDPDYMVDGKPNIPKLKEETAGKIFNELVIKRLEGSTEKPDLLKKTKDWWDKIKEFFKGLLTKIGFDPTIDPLEKAAKQFTKGELDTDKDTKFSQTNLKHELQKTIARINKDRGGKENSGGELQQTGPGSPETISNHLRESKRTNRENDEWQKRKKDEPNIRADQSEIRQYIDKNNLWINKPSGDPIGGGNESAVYKSEDGKKVLKVSDAYYYKSWEAFLNNLMAHNVLFPETAYTIKGFTEIDGELSVVTEQPFIEGSVLKDRNKLYEILNRSGWDFLHPEINLKDFYNKDLGIELRDLHKENVIESPNNSIFFIDTQLFLTPEFYKKIGSEDKFQQETDDEEKDKQVNLFDKLSQPAPVVKKEESEGNSHYEDSLGKKVARVTDTVKKYLTELFKHKHLDEDINKVLQEFKKQFGTANHEDIEHIHNRYVDPSTGLLRDKPLPLESGFIPKSENQEFYDSMEKYLYNTKEGEAKGIFTDEVNFPKGTKFLWEKTIFDPTIKIYQEGDKPLQGLAGTVDFMAIKPNGKVSIFDWKFIGSLSKNEGIRDYMKGAYDKQMDGYVSILTSPSYGIKKSDIEQVRMIPISVKYNELKGHEGEVSSITIGTSDYKAEKTPWLLPYVTKSEQSDSQKVQALVSSLTYQLNKTLSKGSSEKDFLVRKNKIANLERAILHLQLNKDFTYFKDQVKGYIKQSGEDLKKLREEFDNFDPKDVKDIVELNKKLEPLNEMVETLSLYKNNQQFDEYITDPEERRDFVLDADRAKDRLEKVENLLNTYVKKWADSRGIWDILNPQVLINRLSKEFRTLSKSESPVLQTFYKLESARRYKVENRSTEMVDNLKKIWDKVQEFGSIKRLSELVEKKDAQGKGTNHLIDEFDSKTIEQLEKAIKDKNKNEVIKLISSKKFTDWAIPYRKQQLEQIENSTWLAAEGKSSEERKQGAIDKIQSLTVFGTDLAMSNFGILRGMLKDEYQSKEFKTLHSSGNEAALEFYNFALDWNKRAVAAGMFHETYMKSFLPWVEKSLADKLAFGGRWNLLDQLGKSFTTIKDPNIEKLTNPITGEVIKKIPKHFIRDISKFDKEGHPDYNEVSDDLMKNMGLFAHSIIEYESKKEVEDIVEALEIVEKAKGFLQPNAKNQLPITDIALNENLKYAQDMINMHFYNGKENELDAKGGSITIDREEREFSTAKTLDSLRTWFSLNVLGFNTVTSIFRSITTGLTGLYNAGKFYTNGEFMKAYGDFIHFRTMKNDVQLQTALMRLFYPVEENLQEEFHKLSGSKVAQADFQAFSMKMVKSAHNIVQYVNFLAHMENAVIINGKLVNARDYINSTSDKYTKMKEGERNEFEKTLDNKVRDLVNEKGLLKAAKVDENGKLSIDGLDMNDFSVVDMKELIRTQGRMLSGNISESDQSHIRGNALARQMFLFTNWLPQAIDQRFGGLSYNAGKQSYDYGRMRMVMKLATTAEGGVLSKLGTLRDIYMGNDKGVAALNKMYEQHRSDYFKKTGLELNMTSDEFMDLARQNMAILGKESVALLSFITLAMGLNAMLPKKDDPDYKNAQGYFSYMKRIINRGKDELEIFFNPLKFAEFGSGAKLPVLGIFGEIMTAVSHVAKFGYGLTTDDEDLDKLHIVPQILHMTPNLSGIDNVRKMIFPMDGDVPINPDPQGNIVK